MSPKRQQLSQPQTFIHKIHPTLPDYILIGIACLCGLLYVLLLLGQSITPYLLVLLPLAWLFYWVKNRRLSFSTPLDIPILALLLLATLGAFFTPYPDLFLPKLSGLLIGVSVYYLVVNYVRYRQHLTLVIFLLIALALAVALLALIGTDWPVGNLALFDRVYQHLSDFSARFGTEKINKNTIGAALAFFPPLLLSLLWDSGAFARIKSHYANLSSLPELVYKALVLITLALVLLALLLTQSRGAWLGCAAGVFLLVTLKEKRFLWLIPVLIIAFLVILFWRADGSLSVLLSHLDTSQEATLPGRLEIWQKALVILRDFPVTGIGLGAFGEVYRQYFASIVLPSAADVVFHAHNTLLSVAVEVGLPGMVLYVALLGGFGAMAWKTMAYTRTLNRLLGFGLAGGLFAFVVFGLLDAFTLGRNLEVIFWIFLGLMSTLVVHEQTLSSSQTSFKAHEAARRTKPKEPAFPKQTRKRLLTFPLFWLILVLFSLAWVNINILLAFALAVLSGIMLGIHQFTPLTREQP